MKKIILFVITLLMFSLNVNAGSVKLCQGTTSSGSCDSNNTLNNEYFQFKSEYDKGIQTNEVNSKGTIVIYGHSSCNNGSCSHSYVGNTTDYKEVLKKSVKCTAGEKYINFQLLSYVEKNNADDNYSGDMYWNEDFEIICTNTQTSNTVEILNNSNPGDGSNNGNSNGDYSSADPGEQETHGVETYYIILVIAAIITYVISVVIKKQNLFKKI